MWGEEDIDTEEVGSGTGRHVPASLWFGEVLGNNQEFIIINFYYNLYVYVYVFGMKGREVKVVILLANK